MSKIYAFWTGNNAMSDVRKASLASMASSGCEIVLVDNDNIHDFIEPHRLHNGYYYLHYAHRADYLRCYFMRSIGGGYSDIKKINSSWTPYFEMLASDETLWGVGYREISRHGVANIYQSSCILQQSRERRCRSWIQWRWLQLHYKALIGNCAFIFKANTRMVQEWWDELNARMDYLLPQLKQYPARYPKERPGHWYEGVVSSYPVPWSFLLGDILQPLALKYRKRLSRALPPPDFTNYQ